jgi:Subunit ChlI of Mg-chelatase
MLAKLNTFAIVGIDAVPVEAEVDNSFALMPKTVLVGLPEMAVRESIHRIERALSNLDYTLPEGRTVINLAPADLRKDAGSFDLPIALGRLVATRQVLFVACESPTRYNQRKGWIISGRKADRAQSHAKGVRGVPSVECVRYGNQGGE